MIDGGNPMKLQFLGLALSIAFVACSTDKSTQMVFDPPIGGASDNTSMGETTFSFVQENILDRSCALSGCHADSEYPNLSAGQAYDNIVNGLSSSPDQPLINPGDPDNSYLYLKLVNGDGIFGDRMPKGNPPLSDELIAAVRDWIERGAPND
ncbi:MAG: hypothetical protein ACI906_001017 [Candidatus Latescibacterota bacterium]|jgi:hypothetical protein|tara:strand:+ start:349 stop:804 length:456 start_codon:yes stop_codon:yes gene_type:complete